MSKDLPPEISTHAAPIEVPGNPDLSGNPVAHKGWRNPEVLLIFMAAAMPLSFSTWMALLNNFSIEMADFTGREIGILQSLREIPGFMAFGTGCWRGDFGVFPHGDRALLHDSPDVDRVPLF